MGKDYSKLCPKLSKHIPESEIEADLALKVKKPNPKPVMSKKKVEDAYALLKVDPQYSKIGAEVGLWASQIKELHEEMKAYKSFEE